MRKDLTIAAAQPSCVPLDIATNAQRHADAIWAARARVVVFPEMSLTGYELEAAPLRIDDHAFLPVIDACARLSSVALVGAPIEEDGRRYIAMLRIDEAGAAVAYRKSHLHGDELHRYSAGDGPTAAVVDGWRLGMGICKDTGVVAHTEGTAKLGIDVYVAGLVHRPDELDEQDARGQRIAAACDAHVVFASFAGPAGAGYAATAARSTIWSSEGEVLDRATDAPGDIARAVLS